MFDREEFEKNLEKMTTQSKFIQYILETIGRTVPQADAWAVLPFKEETKQLVLLYENTRNYDFFPSAIYLTYKEGFEGLAILKKKPVIFDDFRKAVESRVVRFFHPPNAHVHSVIAVPIIFHERIIGAISIYFRGEKAQIEEHVDGLLSLAELVARPMEEILFAGYVNEQSRILSRSLLHVERIVNNFPLIAKFSDSRTTMKMVLDAIRTVVDYHACGIFEYIPRESRVAMHTEVNIDPKKYNRRLETDLMNNPLIDIITNRKDYLEEVDPGKLRKLGDYRSAVGICIECGKEQPVALVLLHSQRNRYNKFHQEYLKRFAPLFSIICEKEQSERNLEQKQGKILAGDLALILAHEIRNQLNFSINAAKDLQQYFIANKDVLEKHIQNGFDYRNYKKRADLIAEGDKTTKQVLESFIEVTGYRAYLSNETDINLLIKRVIRLLESEAIDKGIAIRTELASDLPPVRTDTSKLQRIITNLVINAIQALSRKNEIVVSSHYNPADRKFPVMIKVNDNGPGISVRIIDKIFEPYFTTKPAGSGLGLAICKRFAEDIGAEIKVDSILNRGTTFALSLPLAREVKHAK